MDNMYKLISLVISFFFLISTCDVLAEHSQPDFLLKTIHKRYDLPPLGEFSFLRKIARKCSTVIELGQAPKAETSWELLHGLSESHYPTRQYLIIDSESPMHDRWALAKKLAAKKRINLIFWPISKMQVEIEPTDMLFIVSLPNDCHLTDDLETFSRKIRKYICILHSSEPERERVPQNDKTHHIYPFWNHNEKDPCPAIKDFLQKHEEWKLVEYQTNNRLTVLKRKEKSTAPKRLDDPLVDEYLKNKMILCTGPAFDRYEMLEHSTEMDMNFIPFKQIFVTTNDPAIMPITFNGKNPASCQLIPNRGKQLDCLNCIITTLKNAVDHPEILDDDIILFKHESVYINDMGLIRKVINKMVNEGYEMVTRTMGRFEGAHATDAFFIKVSAIKDIIKNCYEITEFPSDAPYCEAYFTQYIANQVPHKYSVHYGYHSNGGFTELGFYHVISLAEIIVPIWDRSNYSELFQD